MLKGYHYTDCGLDNVWLVNGYVEKQTPYGTAVSIKAVEKLHEAIARVLIGKPGRLTGREFRFLRNVLGLSQKGFGRIVDTDENGVARWERGINKVPGGVDRLIRLWCEEKMTDDAKIGPLLERLAELDKIEHEEKMTLRLEKDDWKQQAA